MRALRITGEAIAGWTVKEALLVEEYKRNLDRGESIVNCQKHDIESIEALAKLCKFYSTVSEYFAEQIQKQNSGLKYEQEELRTQNNNLRLQIETLKKRS